MTLVGSSNKLMTNLRRARRAAEEGRLAGSLATLNARLAQQTPRRILAISDRQHYTSEQQFAPLIRHRQSIAARLGLVFEFATIESLDRLIERGFAGYAAVGIKLGWSTPGAEAERLATRLFAAARQAGARSLVFDGDDDLCVLWAPVINAADAYIKKHRFADDRAYMRDYVGKTNLTEYVHHTYGINFDENLIPHAEALQPEQIKKIVLGWNIALDDKIHDLANDLGPDTLSHQRDIDLGCRASVGPDRWIYGMRHAATSAMEAMADRYRINAPTNRVPQNEYYDEMLRARLSISPFGYGELCWRDFEAILCGSVLVKPDMSHAVTWPDIFVPNETYIPVAWDFSNLRDVCTPYLEDESARRKIAEAARDRLMSALEPEAFINRLELTMKQAGVL
ncbi:MAG: glycosyltransferase [Gemmobacter sp.]